MISLSPVDTAFCVFSFISALLVLPVPLLIAPSWKNAGLFLFTFYLATSLLFSFINTTVVDPYVSWCHFMARWTALTNIGIPVALTLSTTRLYKQYCNEDGPPYSWMLITIDTVLGILLPVLGCVFQLFTQINLPMFTLSVNESAADLCFPTTPDTTTGIVFIDVPILLATILGLTYGTIVFFRSKLASRLMLFIYTLALMIPTWAYRIGMMTIRAHGSSALRSRYEYEGRWLAVFFAITWAIVWGSSKEALVWYKSVGTDVATVPRRIPELFAGWKSKLHTPRPSTSSPTGTKKFGLHSAGTILRPSRRTLMSQYDAMSFKDVGGLLGNEAPAEAAPPLPSQDVHPSLVFPPPPGQRQSNTFNVAIPLPKQKPSQKASNAIPLHPIKPSSSSVPAKSKSRKERPVAPAVVSYPFGVGDDSFLELKDDEKPLMRQP